MTIKNLLQKGLVLLPSPLESEVLLGFVLKCSRTYLYTWPDKKVSIDDQQHFMDLVNRRRSGEPIAYIIGEKEFWSLPFRVTKEVLIPRPETESVVEQILNRGKILREEILNRDSESGIDRERGRNIKGDRERDGSHPHKIRLLDLGTGSGAIAIAVANECPDWEIVATDISESAIEVAKYNANNLTAAHIQFLVGDWFSALDHLNEIKPFDFVVSNPPYISIDDPHLNQKSLGFEPKNALVSDEDGMYDIKNIIKKTLPFLLRNGYLVIEHGYTQANDVSIAMQTYGFTGVTTHKDLAGVNRVTVAQKV